MHVEAVVPARARGIGSSKRRVAVGYVNDARKVAADELFERRTQLDEIDAIAPPRWSNPRSVADSTMTLAMSPEK